MRPRIDRREATVLLRLTAVVVVVLSVHRVLELPSVWTSFRQRQLMIRAGLAPAASPGETWYTFVATGWPPAAGVLLYLGAGVLARLVTLGLPGPGHCPECGYDLKGSVAGPCPECGARSSPGV